MALSLSSRTQSGSAVTLLGRDSAPCGSEPTSARVQLAGAGLQGAAARAPETGARDQRAATTGILIAIGPSAWTDLDDGSSWASLGDKVSYAMHAGVSMVGQDNENYVLINDNDILARLLF